MGICASCLGKRRVSQETSETEGLLYEDAQPQYGAVDSAATTTGPDPEHLRREREALERICAQTSNELIDVLHRDAALPGSKAADGYAFLLNKHFPNRSGESSPTNHDEAAWLGSTSDSDKELWEEVKGLSEARLVLTLDALDAHPEQTRPIAR